MTELLKIQNRIKHADWPFIIQTFLLYLVFIALGLVFFSGTAAVVFLLVLTTFAIKLTLFHIYRLLEISRENFQYKNQCLQEIYGLLAPRAPLPPMTGWAATPELASVVIKSIRKYRPETILEIGSGVSTLISSYALERFEIDGKVISLDHDRQFAQKTSEELDLHGLSAYVDLRVAPLEQIQIENEEWIWYSKSKMTFDKPIDLLLIDGPPVKTQKNARYPALPLLHQHMAEKSVIIIHDTDRKSESESIQNWLDSFSELTDEHYASEKGITVLKKGF